MHLGMIEFRTKGSIFEGQPSVVVVTVNCVGVAGKGIALEAKKRWPDWNSAYKKTCAGIGLRPGSTWVYDRGPFAEPRWVVSAATKDHWRNPSEMPWVRQALHGLAGLGSCMVTTEPSKPVFAVPALGCGLGGLSWPKVQAEMMAILSPIEGVTWLIFPPQ